MIIIDNTEKIPGLTFKDLKYGQVYKTPKDNYGGVWMKINQNERAVDLKDGLVGIIELDWPVELYNTELIMEKKKC